LWKVIIMKKQFGPVWVIAEQNGCEIEIASLQLIGKARELADELGTACAAVFLGHQIREAAWTLVHAGADRVYLVDGPELQLYQPILFTAVISFLARMEELKKPEIILIGSTCMGRELAPLIAAGLRTGLAAHCTGLRLDMDKKLEALIPAYGGMMSIVCPEKRPQMATVARGVFKMPHLDISRKGQILNLPVPAIPNQPVRTLEIVRETSQEGQLEDARVIIAGGAGACTDEGWQVVRDLAETLNGALACTRPAVDEGRAPLSAMIGQSGKMASPEVYIGVGCSGEQQHMVGIKGANLMVAINNDPKSPVFQQVDIGIAADCLEFLPVLISKIKAFRKARSGCKQTSEQ